MRLLAAPACLALGAGVGLSAVALHGYVWGLALGLAATAATVVALPAGWWARLPFALGWAGVLGVATVQRAAGDYVIAGDASGYLLLAAGMVVLASGVVGLTRRADAGQAPPAP